MKSFAAALNKFAVAVTLILSCFVVQVFAAATASEITAFQGAEGFGCNTSHARGKKIFSVTRLDDFDKGQNTKHLAKGQFRYALAKAARAKGGYIVFNVSGTIQLKRNASIPSNTYIAGQTSPGGVAVEGAAIIIKNAHDVVVRHIRHREAKKKGDAFNIVNSENVILDHVSISFFKDGAVDIVGESKNITIQWSHMGDAIHSGSKKEPYHCEPNLVRDGPDRITFHHNLYTHGHSRMPLINPSAKIECLVEFSNNVIYNFRKYPSKFAAKDGMANVVGNIYIPGSFTHADVPLSKQKMSVSKGRPPIMGSNNFSVYVKDNIMVGGIGHFPEKSKAKDQHIKRGKDAWVVGVRPDRGLDQSLIMGIGQGKLGHAPGVFNLLKSSVKVIPKINYTPVDKVLGTILTYFGSLPRDNTDRRLVWEVLNKKGSWKYDKPNDNNHYTGFALDDSDQDGLPDSFEKQHGENLHPNGHDIDSFYENIEIYLDELHEQLIHATSLYTE